jgi:hypothetical protein
MPSAQNPFVVFCLVAFIVEGIWLFALWCLALARLRHRSLYLVVIAAFLSAATSAMQFVMYYQFPWLLGFLGKQGYPVFYYAFSGMQLIEALLTVIGFTLFVFWLCRTHPRNTHLEA